MSIEILKLNKNMGKEKFINFPKSTKFYKPVTRKESLLILAFMSNFLTFEEEHKKAIGIKHSFDNFIYLNGEVYYDLKEVEKFRKKILKMINKKEDFLLELAKKCEKEGNKITDFTKKINKLNLKELSYDELMKLFKKYFKITSHYIPFLMFPIVVERIYDKKIKDILAQKLEKNKAEEYLSKLIFPEKQNRDYYERINFFNIAMEYQKKGKIDKTVKIKIKNHLEKFSGFGHRYGFGKIWTENDIIARLNAYDAKNPFKEKEKMIKNREKNKGMTEKIFQKIEAPENFKKMVKIIKEYVYLRTLRTEICSLSFADMNPLFKEIGKRNGLDFEHINYSTYQEIINKKFKSKNIIQQRKQKFAFIHNRNDYLILLGEEVEKAKEFYGFQEKNKNLLLINGQIANKGLVKGKAKIIIDNSQLKKINEGDILVAPMTTPDFVPAMEKASAFVTDEGGILCHAAIVAREMQKPCIIGTKIATKVLKDGQLVEVDANKGIVKIIKSNQL